MTNPIKNPNTGAIDYQKIVIFLITIIIIPGLGWFLMDTRRSSSDGDAELKTTIEQVASSSSHDLNSFDTKYETRLRDITNDIQEMEIRKVSENNLKFMIEHQTMVLNQQSKSLTAIQEEIRLLREKVD